MTLPAGTLFKALVVAYSLNCPPNNDAPGPHTATGTVPRAGWTVAAHWGYLKPGTLIAVEGLGWRMVEDKGSGVRPGMLDVYFDSCDEARGFGAHILRVRVWGDQPLPLAEPSERVSSGAALKLAGTSPRVALAGWGATAAGASPPESRQCETGSSAALESRQRRQENASGPSPTAENGVTPRRDED